MENSNVKRLKEVCYMITMCLTLLVLTPSATREGGGGGRESESTSYLSNDKCCIPETLGGVGGISFKVSKNFKLI